MAGLVAGLKQKNATYKTKKEFKSKVCTQSIVSCGQKTAGQLWEIHFSQASELDFREIMQATRQIIRTENALN